MKNILRSTMLAVLLSASVIAQTPEKLSYQSVIRDAANTLVVNAEVGVRISILQGAADAQSVYTETHYTATNANGLASFEIGDGMVALGDFASIDWANGPYFVKIETDPAGGSNYSIAGTSPLLSVPFALHAKTAEGFSGTLEEADPLFAASVAAAITETNTQNWNNKLDSYTETDPAFGAWDKSSGIAISQSQITDLVQFTNEDETDPLFSASVAAAITASDKQNWDNKLESYTETDPEFAASAAAAITETDKQNWNNKLDSYTETDPAFAAWNKSSGIAITESQITDLNHFTNADETDQIFAASVAAAITEADTANWNNKLDSYIETDPTFAAWDKSSGISISESQITDLSHFSYEVGDIKQGFQAADHMGWVKLDGRPIAALSPDQQANAAALGFMNELPDASNAYLSQNGEPAGTVTGDNNKAIQQNQLPNVAPTVTIGASSAGTPAGTVTVGETTSTMQSAGAHAHNLNMVSKDDGNFSNVSGQHPTGDANKFNGSNHFIQTESAGAHVHTMNPHSHTATFAGAALAPHTHSASASSINGGVTQVNFDVKPRTLSVNTFVYLGQ